MTEDPHIPGNILISDDNSIRTADGVSVDTIAGDPSVSGYNEGVGEELRFDHITGMGDQRLTTQWFYAVCICLS